MGVSKPKVYQPCPAREVVQAKKLQPAFTTRPAFAMAVPPVLPKPANRPEKIPSSPIRPVAAPIQRMTGWVRPSVIQRVVSTVTVENGKRGEGHTYKFFGGHQDDPHEDKTNCYDATGKINKDGGQHSNQTSLSMHGSRMATVRARLEEIAGQMQGKGGAYCFQGRERSAIAVFAALYVNHGYSKDEAKKAVVDAIKSSGGVWGQTEAAISHLNWGSLPLYYASASTSTTSVSTSTSTENNNNNNSNKRKAPSVSSTSPPQTARSPKRRKRTNIDELTVKEGEAWVARMNRLKNKRNSGQYT